MMMARACVRVYVCDRVCVIMCVLIINLLLNTFFVDGNLHRRGSHAGSVPAAADSSRILLHGPGSEHLHPLFLAVSHCPLLRRGGERAGDNIATWRSTFLRSVDSRSVDDNGTHFMVCPALCQTKILPRMDLCLSRIQ